MDEFFVEFNVPIHKDLAFAEIFEVSVAARYSDYSNFGDTTNPKFGFRWKPMADLLVRGNYADGFRAPNVSELFAGNSDSFPSILDPCSASANPSGDVLARCRGGIGGIAPVPVGYVPANTQIRITVGGNPTLDAERARNKTLGLVYSPSWAEGLDVYLDWYNIEITNSIGTNSGQFIMNDCYRNGNLASCALITRQADGNVIDLFAGSQNIDGGTEVEGYDLTVDYKFDTSFGKFRINWDTAYLSYFGDVGQPDGANVSGVYFDRGSVFNRIKSNIGLNWSHGDWGAAGTFRYLSGVDEDCSIPVLFGNPGLCSDPDVEDPQFGGTPINHFDDTWYFDLQVTWDAPWDGRITGGVQNLFDEEPPVSFSTFANSFDPIYEVPGRFWYVRYNQKF